MPVSEFEKKKKKISLEIVLMHLLLSNANQMSDASVPVLAPPPAPLIHFHRDDFEIKFNVRNIIFANK